MPFFSETFFVLVITAVVIPMLLVIAPEAWGWEQQARRLRQFQLRHMMLAVVVLAWVMWLLTTQHTGWPLLLAGIVLLVRFLRIWRDEFIFLMDRGDSEFPGRVDKILWALGLICLGPLGVWFFRGYRLAHWPEPEEAFQSPSTEGPVHGRPADQFSV